MHVAGDWGDVEKSLSSERETDWVWRFTNQLTFFCGLFCSRRRLTIWALGKSKTLVDSLAKIASLYN